MGTELLDEDAALELELLLEATLDDEELDEATLDELDEAMLELAEELAELEAELATDDELLALLELTELEELVAGEELTELDSLSAVADEPPQPATISRQVSNQMARHGRETKVAEKRMQKDLKSRSLHPGKIPHRGGPAA